MKRCEKEAESATKFGEFATRYFQRQNTLRHGWQKEKVQKPTSSGQIISLYHFYQNFTLLLQTRG